jgi:hypothetical protein
MLYVFASLWFNLKLAGYSWQPPLVFRQENFDGSQTLKI